MEIGNTFLGEDGKGEDGRENAYEKEVKGEQGCWVRGNGVGKAKTGRERGGLGRGGGGVKDRREGKKGEGTEEGEEEDEG